MAVAPHAQAAARAAREELGLGLQGGITDIVALIEGRGQVPVTIDALPENLSGAFLRARSRPFILLNGTEHPVRQRFTLAHEFGHCKLGHGEVVDGPESFGPQASTPEEAAANRFAAEFLAPLQAVRAWLEACDNPTIDLGVIVRFSVDFGVSAWVARYRFSDARLLNARQEKELDEGLRAGQHRQLMFVLGLTEHQDTITEAQHALPRVPQELRENAFRGYANGLLDTSRLARLLRQSPEAVEAALFEHGVIRTPQDEDADW